MNTDIQSKLAHYSLADVTLVVGAIADQASAAIDTEEAHALSLALDASRVMVDGDDVLTYKFQDSDDGSTGWADVPVDGNLPYSAEGNVVAPVVAGETQNVGCFSNKQFVRIVFNGAVVGTNIVMSLPYVLALNLTENDRYLTNGLPNDGQP